MPEKAEGSVVAYPRIRALSKVRGGGFTLFELIVVVILVAVFGGVLLGRFLLYQEMAEKAAMEQTVGAIRSALNLQMAGLITKGRVADLPKLAEVNPFTFLTETQKNYAGEYYDAAEVQTGNWYYDVKLKQVVYLVHRGDHFTASTTNTKAVRYKVVLVYNELFASEPKSLKDVGGVAFREIEPYQWHTQ